MGKTELFGVEIETVGVSAFNMANKLNSHGIHADDIGYSHLTSPNWKVVPDSSIGRRENSCEIVSPVLNKSDGLDILAKVVEAMTADHPSTTKVRVNSKCGYHVHIDATHLSVEEIKKIVKRYMQFEEIIDSWMPRSRRGHNNSYCQSNKRMIENYSQIKNDLEEACTLYSLSYVFRTRYLKVNLESLRRYKTIEFRHHHGSISQRALSFWVRFLFEFVAESIRLCNPNEPTAIGEAVIVATRKIRGKLGKMLEAMSAAPVNMSDLMQMTGWTETSVRSAIAKLRVMGVQIIRSRNERREDGKLGESKYYAVSQETVDHFHNPENDDIFNGVSSDVREYFISRARFFKNKDRINARN